MERREFQTPLGEVWLWGEPEAFTGRKPVVLVICGAFQSERNVFFDLSSQLGGASLLIGQLPGNHCPEIAEPSIERYAAAYDAVLSAAFPSRPVVVCGVSVGALVTLAMQASQIGRLLLLDPPLVTSKLWPLIPHFRQAVEAKREPWVRPFIESVLGIYRDRVEERDYRPLLNRSRVPAAVLLGSAPLMPERETSTVPSLTDEPERELLRQRPNTRVMTVPDSGHSLRVGPIVRALQLLVGDLSPAT